MGPSANVAAGQHTEAVLSPVVPVVPDLWPTCAGSEKTRQTWNAISREWQKSVPGGAKKSDLEQKCYRPGTAGRQTCDGSYGLRAARQGLDSWQVVLGDGPPGTLRADFVAGGAGRWTTGHAGGRFRGILRRGGIYKFGVHSHPRLKREGRSLKKPRICWTRSSA